MVPELAQQLQTTILTTLLLPQLTSQQQHIFVNIYRSLICRTQQIKFNEAAVHLSSLASPTPTLKTENFSLVKRHHNNLINTPLASQLFYPCNFSQLFSAMQYQRHRLPTVTQTSNGDFFCALCSNLKINPYSTYKPYADLPMMQRGSVVFVFCISLQSDYDPAKQDLRFIMG